MAINCIYRDTSQFYIDEETGNTCLDVCKLMSEDDEHTVYLESAIVNDEFCGKCKKCTPHNGGK